MLVKLVVRTPPELGELASSVLFLLLTPTIAAWATDGGGGPALFAVVAFTVVCTSIWAWRRFVDVGE